VESAATHTRVRGSPLGCSRRLGWALGAAALRYAPSPQKRIPRDTGVKRGQARPSGVVRDHAW